jgi:DNA-binding NtrC family response regulator
MKDQSAIKTCRTEAITILSVSPHEHDHSPVKGLFANSRWTVLTASNISTARALLQEHDTSVVVCECDLMPGTWIDMLNHIQAVPNPPSLIVTSRLADDRLWTEALNRGAYDVLTKPFERTELLRSVRLAWEHWRREVELPAKLTPVMKAAS